MAKLCGRPHGGPRRWPTTDPAAPEHPGKPTDRSVTLRHGLIDETAEIAERTRASGVAAHPIRPVPDVGGAPGRSET